MKCELFMSHTYICMYMPDITMLSLDKLLVNSPYRSLRKDLYYDCYYLFPVCSALRGTLTVRTHLRHVTRG